MKVGLHYAAAQAAISASLDARLQHGRTRGGGLSSAGRPLFRNMIFWDNTSSNAVVSTTNRTTASGVYPNLHMITNVINIWFSDIEYGYPNAVLCITGNPQFVGGGD